MSNKLDEFVKCSTPYCLNLVFMQGECEIHRRKHGSKNDVPTTTEYRKHLVEENDNGTRITGPHLNITLNDCNLHEAKYSIDRAIALAEVDQR